MEVDQQKEKHDLAEDGGVVARFDQNLDKFDYIQQKMVIRELFQEWRSDESEHKQSLEILAKIKNQT